MSPARRDVALLLAPGFSWLSVGACIEALHAAGGLQGEARYEAPLLSLDGLAVADASGRLAATAPALGSAPRPWGLLLLAADPEPPAPAVLALLQQWAAEGTRLGGVGAGAAWLAAAGLLEGQRACADWTLLEGLAEDHPRVAWSQGLWDINPRGDRLSSAGGAAVTDLLCAWLAQLHGEALAGALQQALGWPALRPRDERQRPATPGLRPHTSAKLGEALALMEANLAEPLPTEDVARLVGVSRRQLERLFKQHLDTLPSRHYLALRLQRARRLLTQTPQSILQIGLSCGFASGSHFSNAYKAFHGCTPRDERSRRQPPEPGRPPSPETGP